MANGQDGVTIVNGSNNIIGGDAAAARNFISGNTGNGVSIAETGHRQHRSRTTPSGKG